MTLAPILKSLSRRLDSDHCATASGNASLRIKFARLYAARATEDTPRGRRTSSSTAGPLHFAPPRGVRCRRLDRSRGQSIPHRPLLLGYYTDDGKLHYAGRAGTGITDKELKRLAGVLKPLQVPRMPLAEPPPRDARFGSPLQLSRVHWVRPEVVVEVTYLTWTEDNLLRQVVSGTAGGQARQAGRAACCPSASALALKGMVTEAPPGLGPGKSGAGLFRCGG